MEFGQELGGVAGGGVRAVSHCSPRVRREGAMTKTLVGTPNPVVKGGQARAHICDPS
jgi:hypothetical protein